MIHDNITNTIVSLPSRTFIHKVGTTHDDVE
jgi:hypothetical protein